MKTLFIVAQEGYQDHEYEAPKKILEDAGIEVVTASKKAGTCRGSFGGRTEAVLSLSDVKVADYAAIVFIGGSGAVQYQHDAEAHRIAKEAASQEKLLGAICIAPTILAYAGVLKGKKAAVWDSEGKQKEILEKQGATHTGEAVSVDGKIITANGPPAAERFGREILRALGSS